jgi:hypothetical protein
MGVFCVPAYAAGGTRPTVVAWISNDTLYIEASGEKSAVEAVYINENRVNYRVDDKLALPAEYYAGTERYIRVYAVDFAGNQSDTVNILNPYYSTTSETPPPATPTPTATPTPPVLPDTIPEPVITDELTVEQIPETSDDLNPFTPEGEGEVLDNAAESDGKEFFTVTTEDGNVFYLVIDRQRDGDNVYFLNAVTEQDLLALAETDGATVHGGISAIPTPEPTAEIPTPSPTPKPEPEPEPPEKSASNDNSMYIIIGIAVIGAGVAGYYFKIVRGRKNAPDTGDEEYEDEYGYEDDPDAEDDSEPDSDEEQE